MYGLLGGVAGLVACVLVACMCKRRKGSKNKSPAEGEGIYDQAPAEVADNPAAQPDVGMEVQIEFSALLQKH